jgi:hypothetical protein
VIGGTGVVRRYTVEALRRAGHETVIVARARGVDISTGKGLVNALLGVDTVIDVTNTQGPDAEATRNLFATAIRNLFAAEQRARVGYWCSRSRPPTSLKFSPRSRLALRKAGSSTLPARSPRTWWTWPGRTLAARGELICLIPSWRADCSEWTRLAKCSYRARRHGFAPTTFDAWLKAQSATAPSR